MAFFKFLSALICLLLIGNLGIFPLISMSDIFSIKELSLIPKNISQCDIKHFMTLPIKTITSVQKVTTYIITSIAAHLIGLAVIMSVSTFKTTVILYIFACQQSLHVKVHSGIIDKHIYSKGCQINCFQTNVHFVLYI